MLTSFVTGPSFPSSTTFFKLELKVKVYEYNEWLFFIFILKYIVKWTSFCICFLLKSCICCWTNVPRYIFSLLEIVFTFFSSRSLGLKQHTVCSPIKAKWQLSLQLRYLHFFWPCHSIEPAILHFEVNFWNSK